MSTSAPHNGPFVAVAAFCEKVLRESDGVLSAVRIIDRITREIVGPDAPDTMESFVVDYLTLLIVLRAGEARGRSGIRIRPEAPGGFQLPAVEQAITLAGGSTGMNLIMPMVFPVETEGVYWFDVILTGPPPQVDYLLTRVPLEIIYSPRRFAAPPGA
jgi:hypothetical protein